jgi:purine-binding chemotaxis protein CheW
MSALALVPVHSQASPVEELVSFEVAGQAFGIAARQVQDVLRAQPLTRIPLARPEVAGALNLRGHIVTAINMRVRLGLPAAPAGSKNMCVVVTHENELYSLIVDAVGEVLSPSPDAYESNPASLDSGWREMSQGIFRLDEMLLVVLDIAKLVKL